jgi:hypothetical protein
MAIEELWDAPPIVPAPAYQEVPRTADWLTRAFGFRERVEVTFFRGTSLRPVPPASRPSVPQWPSRCSSADRPPVGRDATVPAAVVDDSVGLGVLSITSSHGTGT